MSGAFEKIYAESLANPAAFWMKAAGQIEWVRRPRAVIDDSSPPITRWFPGGMLNTCYNALDLHVAAGRADQAALIYDSAGTDTVRSFSYRELRDEVARFAGALAELGVERGDVVLLAPACASFDQFASFAERGEAFRTCVAQLAAAGARS